MSNLKDTVFESFTRYAGNVILDRAICDVRDMLKPSTKMLLYSQYAVTKNLPSKPFVKSTRVVGDCLGRYYTHGDQACYGTYMRMAKPFAMRYPLESCQGNSGTLNTPDDHAAARYTELRLAPITSYLFSNIEKESISDWSPNFDDTEEFPKILPSLGFYNIVNGVTGIGVAIASSIPQFNLKETNEAMIKLLWNPDIPVKDIICLPDFATGATILNEKEVRESLAKGQGASCKLRSEITYDEKTKTLKVIELPYGVYTETITAQLQALLEKNPDCGIEGANDGSSQKADYEIYLSKTANVRKVLALLYKETSLQYHFPINMVMLENGKTPKIFNWKEALQAHLDHERIVYIRSFEYDLKKIKYRLHIIEGLFKAISMIDDVVKTIKSSNSTSDANVALQKLLEIDEGQAKAILDIKLSRLAHLEIDKLAQEKSELLKEAERVEAILKDEKLLNKEIEKGLKEVAIKYGDARRTRITNLASSDEEEKEVRMPEENCVVLLTDSGLIKRVPSSNFKTQKRNGIGVKNQDGIVRTVIRTNLIDSLMVFTNKGRMYRIPVEDVPEGSNQTKGTPIQALIEMEENEKAILLYSIYYDTDAQYLLFATKSGIVKKTAISEYVGTRKKNGVAALTLNDGDELVSVNLIKNEELLFITKKGMACRVKSEDISTYGRVAKGVKGINLNINDEVIAILPIRNTNDTVALFAVNGSGKRTALSNFSTLGRGSKGVICSKNELASAVLVDDIDILLAVGSKNNICIAAKDISILDRTALGVSIIKEGDIVRVSKV